MTTHTWWRQAAVVLAVTMTAPLAACDPDPAPTPTPTSVSPSPSPSASPSPTFQAQTIQGSGFRVMIPKDWVPLDAGAPAGSNVVGYRSPQAKNGVPTELTVTTASSADSPSNLAESTKQVGKLAGASDVTDVDGVQIDHEAAVGFGQTMGEQHMLFRFVAHAGSTYTIGLTADSSRSIADLDRELNGYLATWRWTN